MPETAAFCPACGRTMQTATHAQGKVGGLAENIAGGLAYVTFIPAIIFLVVDPYSKNRFVRFHCLQCLLFWGATVVVAAVLRLTTVVLLMIPVLGPLLAVLIAVVAGLALVVIWLVLVVKTFQGEMFKLPILGDFAERHTDSVQALPPNC